MENKFSDLDLDKLNFGLDEETPAAPVAAPEAPATPAPTPAPMEPAVPVTPPAAPTAKEEPASPESNAEPDQDLVSKILAELWANGEQTQEGIEAAKEKAQAAWNDDVVAELTKVQDLLNKETILREKAEREKALIWSEYDKTLDERNALDLEVKQKQRLYGVIDEDDILQAVVAYSYKAKTDDSYKDKLINSCKELLRREWVDVDAANVQAVQSQKAAMGGVGSSATMPWAAPASEDNVSLEWMFEQM